MEKQEFTEAVLVAPVTGHVKAILLLLPPPFRYIVPPSTSVLPSEFFCAETHSEDAAPNEPLGAFCKYLLKLDITSISFSALLVIGSSELTRVYYCVLSGRINISKT